MRRMIFLLILIIILSGCTEKKSNKEIATQMCIDLCKEKIKNGVNLEDGPCLSDEIVDDWVCDVAHFPRIEKDDFPHNQCNSFRAGATHHFVEVDPNCNLIRVY
ncbi:MAG: hypothetical protein QXY45_02035 [Candidatus Aenigmatarchaeota archaeon]